MTMTMTNQKEYTNVDGSDDKKRGVSFKFLSGVAAAIALSSGGYCLLHSNNNSPQSVSMTSTNVLRFRPSSNGGCKKDQDCEIGSICEHKKCHKCDPDETGCGTIDKHGCQTDGGLYWCQSTQSCIYPWDCGDDTGVH
eukprot:CAMPEP_0170795922 /NCGR_PEP_ID=MMETSP0733-20121128/24470_1 /TAXON_ID=186038 /ORGANISM="Fragilariopsis kerguelensis, Strain L26-C5" /LENGTH=137 /DNA_ID=CAMNT_0011146019 /DNA_START=144 /DNA_END=557 /DNA_ORIENTATION=-